jgi:nitrile hydratase
MGLVLADDVQINVWDSSAEIRYMVLPQQPPDTLGETESELAARVSRDVMIGVAR